MAEKINLNSKVAYYLQMKEILQAKIERGDYKPGDRLPSELDFCRMFKVSRTVVRQALMELEYEGLIIKQRPKGTFVAEPKMVLAINYLQGGFGESLTRQGLKVVNRVLTNEVIPATINIAANFNNVEAGEELIHIERVRYVDGKPLVLSKMYIPLVLCPQLKDVDFTQSIYDALRELGGIKMERGEINFEAVGANERESEIFDLPVGTPMLLHRAKTFDQQNNQIEYALSVFRGDQSRVEGVINKGN